MRGIVCVKNKISPKKNFFKSIAFRLVAIYLLLFALSVGTVLTYLYWNTAGLLARQTDATIEAEIVGLNEQYRQGGISQLARIIDERSKRNRRENGKSLYLVTDFTGKRLVGNLNTLPVLNKTQNGWIEFSYRVNGEEEGVDHIARARLYRLLGGFKLVVGRDVQERRDFANLIETSVFWAVFLALLLGLAGGILISRNMIRKIEAINQTSENIMAGDLSQRIPVTGSGDEMDRLALGLNDMLSQIQTLMGELSQVTDNIAHDLKTPLTRLRANIEAALRTNNKAAYRDALQNTLGEADGLLKTFNALLSLARIEAGQGRSNAEEIDLGALLEDVAELYEPLIEERGGRLDMDKSDGLVVKADRQLLSQAVTNIFDNILKYASLSRGNALVRVETQRQGAQAKIVIADQGPGIPQDLREEVLKRFTRLDESRSKPGSGLGLSLVKSVIEFHGGSLTLSDTRKHKQNPGLKIEIYLPIIS